MINVNSKYSQEFSVIPFCEGVCIFKPLSKKLLLRSGNIKQKAIPKDIKKVFFSYSLKFESDISKIWNSTLYFLEDNPDILKVEISDVFPSISSAIEKNPDLLEETLDKGCGTAPLGTVMSCAHILLLIKYGSNENIPSKLKFVYEYIDNYTKALSSSFLKDIKIPVSQNMNTVELSSFVKTFTKFSNFALLNDAIKEYCKKRDIPITKQLHKNEDVYNRNEVLTEVKDRVLTETPYKIDKFSISDILLQAELDIHGLDTLIPLVKETGTKPLNDIGTMMDVISSIAVLEKLNLYSILGDIKLTRKDVETLVGTCIYSEKSISQTYTKEDYILYSFSVIFKLFCMAYKTAKKEHDNVVKLLKKEKGIDEEPDNSLIEGLQGQISTLKLENAELKRKNSSIKSETEKKFLQEIRALTKKLDGLKSENESLLKSKEELNALRDFFFKIEHEYEPVKEECSLRDVIDGKKIVVIGGPEPWLIRMRPLYPEIKFLSGESNSLNIEVVQSADHVFIYSSHLTHSLYYRIMKICKGRGVKYSYLGYRQNPEFIESEMIESLLD